MKIYKYLLSLVLIFNHVSGYFFSVVPAKKPFLMVIEAQGNVNSPGRIIDDSFESEITFNAAHFLKNTLENMHPSIKILVQRSDGLSNAQAANKIDADLYLCLSACKSTKSTSTGIVLFRFDYRHQFILKDGISFIPYDQIYLLNQPITISWINSIGAFLSDHNMLRASYACPYRPLMGVRSPAIGLELLLYNKSELTQYMTAVAHSLTTIIKGSGS